MNERQEYMQIINLAKKENRIKSNQQYFEKHHILPKSLFPLWEKRGLILLTPKEHFRCHYLLTKIFPSRQMWNAFVMLSGRKIHNYKLTEEEYANYKKHVLSKEELKKRSDRIKGKNNPQYGKSRTKEEKERFKDLIGYKIICIETKEKFKSQKEASLKLKLERTSLVKHLQGHKHYTNVKGFHFKFLEKNRNLKRKSWSEETKQNFSQKQGKKLMCIETKEVFNSQVDVAKVYNIPYTQVRRNSNKQYHFKEIN